MQLAKGPQILLLSTATAASSSTNEVLSHFLSTSGRSKLKELDYRNTNAMNKFDTMGATTFTARPRKQRTIARTSDENSNIPTNSQIPSISSEKTHGSGRSILGQHLLSQHFNSVPGRRTDSDTMKKYSVSSNAIPISMSSSSKLGREYADYDQQVAENTRLYDSSTWRMYHRIMEGRSRKPRSAVAPAPARSQTMQYPREQSRRAWDRSIQEEVPDNCGRSEHASEEIYEDVFTLDWE